MVCNMYYSVIVSIYQSVCNRRINDSLFFIIHRRMNLSLIRINTTSTVPINFKARFEFSKLSNGRYICTVYAFYLPQSKHGHSCRDKYDRHSASSNYPRCFRTVQNEKTNADVINIKKITDKMFSSIFLQTVPIATPYKLQSR